MVPTPKKVKIGPKTVDCIFIGYAHTSSAYWFLEYESEISNIHKNTIMESRNASLFEHVFSCRSIEDSSSSKRTHETIVEDSQDHDQNDEIEDEPRRSKRVST